MQFMQNFELFVIKYILPGYEEIFIWRIIIVGTDELRSKKDWIKTKT